MALQQMLLLQAALGVQYSKLPPLALEASADELFPSARATTAPSTAPTAAPTPSAVATASAAAAMRRLVPSQGAVLPARAYIPSIYIPRQRASDQAAASTTRARGRHGRGADAARAARTSRCLPPCCQSAAPRRSCAKPWHYIIGGII